MCFLRRTAGYTRSDRKGNEDIFTELQISQITEFIYRYRESMLIGQDAKNDFKMPTKRKRNLGRPLK
jgi:hypothetical protein